MLTDTHLTQTKYVSIVAMVLFSQRKKLVIQMGTQDVIRIVGLVKTNIQFPTTNALTAEMASFRVRKKLVIRMAILDVILTAGHAKISIQFPIVNALTVEMDSFRAQNIVM